MPDARAPSRFAHPYSMREALRWIVRNVVGPAAHRSGIPSLPKDSVRHRVRPALSLGFIGDVLPPRKTAITVDASVRRFFSGIDFLVANFEGTLVGRPPRWVFMGQRHDERTLELLQPLAAPTDTVLLCMNNHSLDYGVDAYRASVARLRAAGYRVVDDRQTTIALSTDVTLSAATAWSNQPAPGFTRLAEVAAAPPASSFRILCPHWGYELEDGPRKDQIADGDTWIRTWDMIVGHHSHTPQPVTERPGPDRPRVIAYSLGNFSFGFNLPHHCQGVALRVEVGPGPDSRWCVGRLRWTRLTLAFRGDHTASIGACGDADGA